jgi:hypothetical protein
MLSRPADASPEGAKQESPARKCRGALHLETSPEEPALSEQSEPKGDGTTRHEDSLADRHHLI